MSINSLLGRYFPLYIYNSEIRRYIKQLAKDTDMSVESVSLILQRHYHEIPKKLRLTNVVGPYYVSFFTIQNKKIYLFGERHAQKNTCLVNALNFDKFLECLIVTFPFPNKKLDVFLELAYKKTKTQHEQQLDPGNMLLNIRKRFGSCLEIIKKDCPYPWLRAHYADVRELFPYQLLINALGIALFSRGVSQKKVIDDAIKIFKGWSTEKILQEAKINKQLANTEPLLAAEIQKLKKEGSVLLNHLQNIKYVIEGTRNKELLGKLIDKEMRELNADASFVFDMYVLARMFRTFRDGDSPEHIVVYAGDHHINVIQDILLKIGASLIKSQDNGNKSGCVNVTDFLPFF